MIAFFILFFTCVSALYFEIEVGQSYRYQYQTTITNCGTFLEKQDYTSFSSIVDISLIWANIAPSYDQQSINKLYMIKEKIDIPYLSQSDYDALNLSFYFHAYDNQVSPVIFSNHETNKSMELKKALISIYQLTGHNMTERDTGHDCQSTYILRKNNLIKRRICNTTIFSKFSVDKSLIPSCYMKSISKSMYIMNSDLKYFKVANVVSHTKLNLYINMDYVIFNCSTNQKLTFINKHKLPKDQIIIADNLNDALISLNSNYMKDFHGQALKFNPEYQNMEKIENITKSYESLISRIQIMSRELKERHLSSLDDFVDLIKLMKRLEYADLDHLLELTMEKFPDDMDIFVEALSATRTNGSETLILLHFLGLDPQSDFFRREGARYFGRVNVALNLMGGDVAPGLVHGLMDIISQFRGNEEIAQQQTTTLLPTLGGLLFKLCRNNMACRHKEAQDPLKRYFNYIGNELDDIFATPNDASTVLRRIVPILISLTNLKVFYSARIITGLIQELVLLEPYTPRDHQSLAHVLTLASEGLDTFDCHNFRTLFQHYLPAWYREGFVSHDMATPPDLTLSILNRIYFKASPMPALARNSVLSLLLRCDFSYAFVDDVVKLLIRDTLTKHGVSEVFTHQYHTIYRVLKEKISDLDGLPSTKKEAQSLMVRLFPYYITNLSHRFYVPTLPNNIGSAITETNFYMDSLGILKRFDIKMFLKSGYPLQATLYTQGIDTLIKKMGSLSSFFTSYSSSDDPYSLEKEPFVSIKLSAGSRDFFPITLIKSSSDLTSILFTSKQNQNIMDTKVMVQDIEGAFSLPNGFPVYIKFYGALKIRSHYSLSTSLFKKEYKFRIENDLKYVADSRTHLYDRSYQSNVSHTSKMAYSIGIKGYLSDSNYHCMQIYPSLDRTSSNHTASQSIQNGGLENSTSFSSPVSLRSGQSYPVYQQTYPSSCKIY